MSANNRYLSFSGGGWNSMTGSAAFVGAALQAARKSQSDYGFDKLFTHIEGVGSISGGSWFASMLSNSAEFTDALANRPGEWFNKGYMGIQKDIFTAKPPDTDIADAKKALNNQLQNLIAGDSRLSSRIQTAINSQAATLLADKTVGLAGTNLKSMIASQVKNTIIEADIFKTLPPGMLSAFKVSDGKLGLDWLDFTKNTVYSAYGMKNSFNGKSLSKDRNKWAKNVDLIMTTAYDGNGALNYAKATGTGFQRKYDNFLSSASNSDIFLPSQFVSAKDSSNYARNPFNETKDGQNGKIIFSGKGETNRQGDTLDSNFKSNYSSSLDIIETTAVSSAAGGIVASTDHMKKAIKNSLQTYIRRDIEQKAKSQVAENWKLTDGILNLYLKGEIREKIQEKLGVNLALDLDTKRYGDTFIDNFIPYREGKGETTITDDIVEELVYTLQTNALDAAVPLKFQNNEVNYSKPDEDGLVSTLQSNENYRFYDGGYCDNTGIAGVVSNIQKQKNGTKSNLNLTFFVNNYSELSISKNLTGGQQDLKVASDAAYLFGINSEQNWKDKSQVRNKNFASSEKYGSLDAKVAFPYIFNKDAWRNKTEADWEWSNYEELLKNKKTDEEKNNAKEEATYLKYYKLNVETVDNKYWNIEKGQKGVVNIFTSIKPNSLAAPTSVNFFDIYEALYDQTRKGILDHGGYIHLLGALGIQDLKVIDSKKLKFNADQNIKHKIQANFDESSALGGSHLHLVELYVTDSSNNRRYLGSIGGSAGEKGFNFKDDVNPELFQINKDDVIDFVYKDTQNNLDLSSQLIVDEYKDNNFKVRIMNESMTEEVSAITVSFVAHNSENDSLGIDPTERQSSDDTYFYIEASRKYLITADAVGAFTNKIGMIKIDIDPITGVATHAGFQTDTAAFDLAARESLNNNLVGFESQILNSSTKNIEVQWTAPADGYYAPAMITEEDKLFVLNHSLNPTTTNTRMAGEYTVAFEDTVGNQSDLDFNDLVVRLMPVI